MDERKQARGKHDDVPIIGDYSAAANERIRAESQRASPPPEPPFEPLPEPPAKRAAPQQMRVDPADVRRYAKLARQRAGAGRFTKVVRYGMLALLLIGAFAVYRNFDTLRGVTIDVSTLTSLFADRPRPAGAGRPAASGEPATVAVEGGGVAGAEIATSLGGEPLAEEPAANDAPVSNVATTANAPPPTPAEPPPSEEPVSAAAVPPPPPPEPPPGPESFEFGLTALNVSEADASAAIVILRNGDRRRASSVIWSTRDGTATAGVDYADLGMMVVRFAAGEQNSTIHVPIVGDRNVEGPETFYVYLAAREGADPAAEQLLEVTIGDDD